MDSGINKLLMNVDFHGGRYATNLLLFWATTVLNRVHPGQTSNRCDFKDDERGSLLELERKDS